MGEKLTERYFNRAELEAEADARAALMYPSLQMEKRRQYREWYFDREAHRRSSPFPMQRARCFSDRRTLAAQEAGDA
jgi:hypothetical protein